MASLVVRSGGGSLGGWVQDGVDVQECGSCWFIGWEGGIEKDQVVGGKAMLMNIKGNIYQGTDWIDLGSYQMRNMFHGVRVRTRGSCESIERRTLPVYGMLFAGVMD